MWEKVPEHPAHAQVRPWQRCAWKCLTTTWVMEGSEYTESANFHGANAPTTADFKLPARYPSAHNSPKNVTTALLYLRAQPSTLLVTCRAGWVGATTKDRGTGGPRECDAGTWDVCHKQRAPSHHNLWLNDLLLLPCLIQSTLHSSQTTPFQVLALKTKPNSPPGPGCLPSILTSGHLWPHWLQHSHSPHPSLHLSFQIDQFHKALNYMYVHFYILISKRNFSWSQSHSIFIIYFYKIYRKRNREQATSFLKTYQHNFIKREKVYWPLVSHFVVLEN